MLLCFLFCSFSLTLNLTFYDSSGDQWNRSLSIICPFPTMISLSRKYMNHFRASIAGWFASLTVNQIVSHGREI